MTRPTTAPLHPAPPGTAPQVTAPPAAALPAAAPPATAPRLVRVGVVEDDATDRTRLLALLRRFEQTHPVTFQTRTFVDGAEIAHAYRSDLDVILLDVQMPGLDGMETARRIRALDADVLLVFITSNPAYATQGYEVDALGYLVKPVPYVAFAQELRRALRRLHRVEETALLLPTRSGTARVRVRDVLWASSTRHRIDVHTYEHTYTFSGTLKALEPRLSPAAGFIRCNSCYLVNLRGVVELRPTSVVLSGGTELAVSRSRRRAVVAALTDQVAARTG